MLCKVINGLKARGSNTYSKASVSLSRGEEVDYIGIHRLT